MVVIISCIACFCLGIEFERVLFKNKVANKQDKRFISSEYLLHFFVEVITIVLGIAVTLGASQLYTDYTEDRQCIEIMDQVTDIGSRQISEDIRYYSSLRHGRMGRDYFARHDTLPVEFYESKLNDTLLVSRLDMDGYYEIVRYLTACKTTQERLDELIYDEAVDDDAVLKIINSRNMDFYKMLINLKISNLQCQGKLQKETCDEMRKAVKETGSYSELRGIIEEHNLGLPVFNSEKGPDE